MFLCGYRMVRRFCMELYEFKIVCLGGRLYLDIYLESVVDRKGY